MVSLDVFCCAVLSKCMLRHSEKSPQVPLEFFAHDYWSESYFQYDDGKVG